MVLYKLPLSKASRLLTASLIDKTKQSFTTAFSLYSFDAPKLTPVHQFNQPSKLNLWTMITDTIFGGSSTCRLGFTENQTFLFSGELCGPLQSHAMKQVGGNHVPNQIILNSFCRMWYIYVGFHKDLSDFSGLRITFRILNNNNNNNNSSSRNDEENDSEDYEQVKNRTKGAELKDFQCQLQHHDFMDDLFFYCPFHFNSEKQVIKDEETGEEWISIRLPFDRFALNKMGTELGVSGDWIKGETISDTDFLKFARNESVPVQDVVSIGIGVSSNQRSNFSIELKQMEAY